MKKYVLVAGIALLLVILCVVLLLNPNEPSQEAEETTLQTELTQPDAQPTEEVVMPVFENGNFSFTAGQFPKRFQGTLPDGYAFTENVIGNPERDNLLEVEILTDAGEQTGMRIVFNTKELDGQFCHMGLTAGTDSNVEVFSDILEWYIAEFMTQTLVEERQEILQDFLKLYTSGTDDYRLLAMEHYTVMMTIEKSENASQYNVLIAVG